MERPERLRDIAIGLGCVGLALLILLIWIPADVDTGIVDVWRRNVRIGDAMLPSFATAGVLFAGVGVMMRALLGLPGTPIRPVSPAFGLAVAAILAATILLFLYTGPLLTALFHDAETTYREIRHLAPWKYAGVVAGGTFLVFALICLVRHEIRLRSLVIALVSTLVMAAVYDLPFDGLLLPPNGDY
ncbi:hypothetical protein E1180_18300 [Roseibium denhamense]|uniref:Tripartite tricarboxylate transporter TctB family protein n=1 Tax=Roseibium denhamense TaxID=76305 RepID=A0ABY1PCM7_9HYPH|nr:hypothetical protein [Roseibium denhamense]MTI07456.1 hypothetical protein [Roseibium denhamense]SMP29854.1 hypothetical protein SAMN06265374_3149 [Roseibium denhamense]